MPKKETKTVNDLMQVTQNIGDKLASQFEDNSDVKTAQAALFAYKVTIDAAKAQVIYKKLTGNPSAISFFDNV